MKVEVKGNVVEVYEVIKTISDSQTLISTIENLRGGSVVLRIYDSFTLPSSVIGFLLKLKDSGTDVKIEVRDEILYELMDDLNLTTTFSIRKI